MYFEIPTQGSARLLCKHCQSEDIKKYGKVKHVQRYFCNNCKRKFVSTETIPKMRAPIRIIADAINMRYDGMSLSEIRVKLNEQYCNYTSRVTVYNWEKRFTTLAIMEAEKYTPHVGSTWIVYETLIHSYFGERKKKRWIIDILDADSKFLLITKLSYSRNQNNAIIALEQASAVSGKTPERILTNGWEGYQHSKDDLCSQKFKCVKIELFVENDTIANSIENWKDTLTERTKVLNRLKTFDSMVKFLKSWAIHYNFFKHNPILGLKTPGQVAGINFPYQNWRELIQKQNR
jgi:transposase-like protein